jgi:hypothetical protein
MEENKIPDQPPAPASGQVAVQAVQSTDQPSPKRKEGVPAHMTATEREQLGKEVTNLRLDGLSFNRIAEKLARAKSTCIMAHRAYICEYKKTHAGESDVLVGLYNARMERIINQALGAYANTIPEGKQTGDVQILFKLASLLGDHFDKLQSTGSIDKVKEQVEHSGVVELQNFVKEFWKKKVPAKADAKKAP